MRIDAVRREVVATAPSVRRLADAVAFARSTSSWAKERLQRLPTASPLRHAQILMLFGAPYRLQADGRRTRVTPGSADAPGVIGGCGASEPDRQLVVGAIRSLAAARFDELIDRHRRRLGASAPLLTISDTRARWGSCAPARDGRPARIRLSWRLALAPPPVADYVAAHECAHLVEANHGPAFWALVQDLVGDPREPRAWLRANGATLQAFAEAR